MSPSKTVCLLVALASQLVVLALAGALDGVPVKSGASGGMDAKQEGKININSNTRNEKINVGTRKTTNYNYSNTHYKPTQLTQVVLNVPPSLPAAPPKNSRKSRPATEEEQEIKDKIMDLFTKAKNEKDGDLHKNHLGKVLEALNPKYIATQRVRRVVFSDPAQFSELDKSADETQSAESEPELEQEQSPEELQNELDEKVQTQLDDLMQRFAQEIQFTPEFLDKLGQADESKMTLPQLAFKRVIDCVSNPSECSSDALCKRNVESQPDVNEQVEGEKSNEEEQPLEGENEQDEEQQFYPNEQPEQEQQPQEEGEEAAESQYYEGQENELSEDDNQQFEELGDADQQFESEQDHFAQPMNNPYNVDASAYATTNHFGANHASQQQSQASASAVAYSQRPSGIATPKEQITPRNQASQRPAQIRTPITQYKSPLRPTPPVVNDFRTPVQANRQLPVPAPANQQRPQAPRQQAPQAIAKSSSVVNNNPKGQLNNFSQAQASVAARSISNNQQPPKMVAPQSLNNSPVPRKIPSQVLVQKPLAPLAPSAVKKPLANSNNQPKFNGLGK